MLADAIGVGLRREGMAVDIARDGHDALGHLAVTRYDVVVLDRDLPGVHGDEVCRRIVSADSGSRVLMLTAASTVRDKVDGLGLGADDYLSKPFDFAELVARVRALGRRSAPAVPPVLEGGDISLDPGRQVALRAGRRLDLSPKEFALLECLLAADGRVVSAEELLDRVWDEAADPFTTTVKTTIRRLRGKLGEPPVIETVREAGYRIGPAVNREQGAGAACGAGSGCCTRACSSLTGIVLLVIADLPTLSIGSTVRAPVSAGRPGAGDHARFTTNLPEVLLYSGIALVVLAAASVILGWLVAHRALRPLRAITATAGEISASDLTRRLEVAEAYDEFRDLGDTLDGLLARLEAAFDSQRQFIANASHELRTPLTAERTVLQVVLADPSASTEALRRACQQVLSLGEQQEHLIDALLTLASSQRGLRQRERVDLAALAGAVIDARGREAADRGLSLEAHLDPAVADGDPSLAESLVANLVDNAIRHNVAGGRVRVVTATRAAGASIEISNTGPMVPPGTVARLFEPFQRLDTRLSAGHGLGLAIVAAIAAAHDASLDASPRPEGGLDITVRFPR